MGLEKDLSFELHVLSRETLAKLESYAVRVKQGRDLDAASEFAKYVIFGGVAKLLKPYERDGLLPIQGAEIAKAAESLRLAVGHAYATGAKRPTVEPSDLAGIHRKLDLIASHVARLPASPAIQPEPEIRVLKEPGCG